MSEAVKIYAFGLFYMSICAPETMPVEAAVTAANRKYDPDSELNSWRLADQPFKTGETNPCPCSHHAGRLHYLLEG